jgi:predicted nucleotidyltransferase
MSFQQFVRTESRKAFQGKFTKTDYFIRFVKNWNEIDEKYGDIQYRNIGYAKIKATIADDSESIFTPCKYTLEKTAIINGPKLPQITEIASFRGRFCEIPATIDGKPTTVEATGKVEQVTNTKTGEQHNRLLVGNNPCDHIIITNK